MIKRNFCWEKHIGSLLEFKSSSLLNSRTFRLVTNTNYWGQVRVEFPTLFSEGEVATIILRGQKFKLNKNGCIGILTEVISHPISKIQGGLFLKIMSLDFAVDGEISPKHVSIFGTTKKHGGKWPWE
jgi:hypothetical protein